jgi:hypothetical protein
MLVFPSRTTGRQPPLQQATHGGVHVPFRAVSPSPPPTPHSGLWRWQWMRAPASVPSHPGYGSRQEARRAVPWGGGLEFGQKQHAHTHTQAHARGWRLAGGGSGVAVGAGSMWERRGSHAPPGHPWPFGPSCTSLRSLWEGGLTQTEPSGAPRPSLLSRQVPLLACSSSPAEWFAACGQWSLPRPRRPPQL